MSQLHVPTLPQPVTLLLSSGDEEEVTIYLANSSSKHSGVETLDEFLNSDRRFFAIKRKSGHSALIRRRAVIHVRVAADSPLVSRRESATMPAIDLVRVRFDNGTEIDGVLLHIDREGHERLSDTLNEPDDFFAVEVNDGVLYVNKHHVVSLSL